MFLLGLLSMLGWSLAVSTSMPSWFDPDRDCREAFPFADGDRVRITTQWLPPRAVCDYGTEVHQFISPTRSTVLTIIFVLTAAFTTFGLYCVLRRLAGPPGLLRSAEAVNLRTRRIWHLGVGGGLTLLALGVYAVANVFAAVLGGPPGALIMAVAAIAGLAALATKIDRGNGPLPSTARDSRRRGTVAALATYAVIFVVSVASGKFPSTRSGSLRSASPPT